MGGLTSSATWAAQMMISTMTVRFHNRATAEPGALPDADFGTGAATPRANFTLFDGANPVEPGR
jgi:hypothetical protein